MASGSGTREDPWVLTTPSGGSEYTMFRDESLDPPALVCRVGKTELRYHLRAIDDLHAMLKAHGDWMLLGSADEQNVAEGHCRSLGALGFEPGGRLVRLEEGAARPLRDVCPTGARSDDASGGGAPAPQQPHASDLNHTSIQDITHPIICTGPQIAAGLFAQIQSRASRVDDHTRKLRGAARRSR